MEMETTISLGGDGQVDDDDLITYDDDEEIDWTPNSAKGATPSVAQAPDTITIIEEEIFIEEVEVTADAQNNGDVRAEGSDVKMLSAVPSVADEDGLEVLGWDAGGDEVHDNGEDYQNGEVHEDNTHAEATELAYDEEEILYDEDDFETDGGIVNPQGEGLGPAVNASEADLHSSTEAVGADRAEDDGGYISGDEAEENDEINYDDEVGFTEGAAELPVSGGDYFDADDAGAEPSRDDHDQDGNDDLADNLIFVKEVTIVQDDGEGDAEEGSHIGEPLSTDIPRVTVHYKGGDFPLFRGDPDSNNALPFFSSTEPLDSTMDVLLYNFRQELSDEIGLNDEIVFQIEELGLEYCEVSFYSFPFPACY